MSSIANFEGRWESDLTPSFEESKTRIRLCKFVFLSLSLAYRSSYRVTRIHAAVVCCTSWSAILRRTSKFGMSYAIRHSYLVGVCRYLLCRATRVRTIAREGGGSASPSRPSLSMSTDKDSRGTSEHAYKNDPCVPCAYFKSCLRRTSRHPW